VILDRLSPEIHLQYRSKLLSWPELWAILHAVRTKHEVHAALHLQSLDCLLGFRGAGQRQATGIVVWRPQAAASSIPPEVMTLWFIEGWSADLH
jgi:hypothetical protein